MLPPRVVSQRSGSNRLQVLADTRRLGRACSRRIRARSLSRRARKVSSTTVASEAKQELRETTLFKQRIDPPPPFPRAPTQSSIASLSFFPPNANVLCLSLSFFCLMTAWTSLGAVGRSAASTGKAEVVAGSGAPGVEAVEVEATEPAAVEALDVAAEALALGTLTFGVDATLVSTPSCALLAASFAASLASFAAPFFLDFGAGLAAAAAAAAARTRGSASW